MKDQVSPANFAKEARALTVVSPKQFFGIELDGFGVELAKVTLMLAKKLALTRPGRHSAPCKGSWSSPATHYLDNLDDNIRQEMRPDRLARSGRRLSGIRRTSRRTRQAEMDLGYLHELRDRHPMSMAAPTTASHWFRLAHDRLEPGHRAGPSAPIRSGRTTAARRA